MRGIGLSCFVLVILLLPVAFAELNVTIDKMAPRSTYNVSEIIVFNVSVNNTGTSNYTGINITDYYNASFLKFLNSSVQPTMVDEENGSISWINVSNFFLNETNTSSSFQINFSARDNISLTRNAINATVQNETLDAVITNSSTFDLQISEFILNQSAVKENLTGADALGIVQFRLIINNTGTTNFSTVNLTDSFNASILRFNSSNLTPDLVVNNTPGEVGLLFWSNISASHTNTLLFPGQAYVILVNFNILTNLTVTNRIDTLVIDETGNTSVTDANDTILPTAPVPNVTLDKTLLTANPSNKSQSVQFRMVINNTGITNFTFMNLTDVFNGSALGFTAANLTPSSASNDTGLLLWTNLTFNHSADGLMQPNQFFTILLNFSSLNASPVPTANNATVTTAIDQFLNPATANDADSVTIAGDPNMTINKTLLSLFTVNVTQLARFMINITNIGETNLTNVTLNDTFDGTLLGFLASNASFDAANNVSGNVHFPNVLPSPLVPGQSFHFEVNLSAVNTSVGQVNNNTNNTITTERILDIYNKTLANQTSTSFVRINHRPNITVAKIILSEAVTNITLTARFMINITNTGQTNLTAIPVADTFNGSAMGFYSSNVSFNFASNTTGLVNFTNIVSAANPLIPGASLQIDLTFNTTNPSILTSNNVSVGQVADFNGNNPDNTSASANLTINGIPNATVDDVLVTVSPINVSGGILFLINITNNGQTNITSLTLLDTFDKSSLQFDLANVTATASSNLTGQINYSNLTSNFGSITPNQTILIALNFTATSATANATNNVTITNIVDLNGNPVANDSASTGVEVQGAANLSITKALLTPNATNVSLLVQFLITINNTGQTNLTSITLNDTFDGSYLQFDWANVTPTTSSNDSGFINFLNLTNTAALAINQSIQIQLNFTARASTVNTTNNVTTNLANITLAKDQFNNDVINRPFVMSTVRINDLPNLTVTKTLLTPAIVNRTQTVRFLVVLNNTGQTNITTLPLNDTFNGSAIAFTASNVSFASASNTSGEVLFTGLASAASPLVIGAFIAIELNFTAVTESFNTTNNATVHTPRDMNDNTLDAPSSRGDFEIVQINGIANITINKTRTTVFTTNRTELVRFQITINNTGETAITNLTLNDTYNGSFLGFLGANKTIDLANNASGSLHFPNVITTALQPNQTLQIEINFSAVETTVGQAENATTNTIIVQSLTDENGNSIPSLSGYNHSDTVRINNRPNISIEKGLLSESTTNTSQLIRYRINITNNGETNLNNLTFNDTFNGTAIGFVASNTTFESASNASGFVVFANLVSAASPLAPNQTRVIDVNFTAIAPSLSTNNSAATALVIDTNANNPDSSTDSIALTINGIPNASVGKVLVSVSPANISGRVSFLITISNNGTTNITSLTLLDTFDKSSLQFDLTNVTATASSNLTGQINYTNLTTITGALIPNQTVTIHLNFTATGIADNATNNVTITNIVDLNNNPVPATSASTGVEVQGAANLSITKQLTSLNGSNVSQLVQFLITINNTGQTDLETITLNDAFDGSYLGFEAANVSPSTANNATGQITFANLTSLELLAVNQSIVIHLNFTARASTINNSNNVTANLGNVTLALDEFGNAVINAPSVTSTVRINNQPNITLSKVRVTPATANVSSTIIFEVNVTNIGLTNLTAIPITDFFNGSVMGFVAANVSVAAASNATGTVTITNLLGAGEQLAPGATRTIRLNFSAIAPAINTLNNASAGTVTDFNGYNPSNASSGDVVNITGIINISAAKTLESENPTNVSLTVHYFVNITNLGQHNLTTVALSDTFNASAIGFTAANISVTSASNATGTIFIANALTQALIPNASVIIALNFSAFNTSTANNNSVAVNAQDLNSNNVTSSAFAIVPNITLAINVTNLSVAKIASTAYENVSDNISFLITINNTGNQPVSGILVNDSVSANYLEFASSNITVSTNSSSGVVINNALSGLANLSPNSSFVLNLVFTARRNITNVTNIVTVTITDVNGNTSSASAAHNVTIIAMNSTATAFSGNTTNFNNASDITNVSNATLENGNATIVWSNGINANGADFNSNVLLGSGFVIVNSSALNPTINSSANVTIKGVSCPVSVIVLAEGDFDNAEEIRQNGRDCEVAGVCTNKVCSGGTLSFTVSHFTGFAAGANANLTIDANDPKAENAIVTFNASYVNGSGSPITNASCNLTLPNATTVNMTNLSTHYETNATFNTAGGSYNVTCGVAGFTTLTAIDTFTITASPSTAIVGLGGGSGGRRSTQAPACQDGLDNDGDGLIDFVDPGCTTFNDYDESNPAAASPIPSPQAVPVRNPLRAFDLLDLIRDFYAKTQPLSAFDVIDKIKEFYHP